VAMVLEIGLWAVLSRREHQARWGDARRGLYESLIRWALINLQRMPVSPRNWRPHVLVFVEDIRSEFDLVRFADWFSQARGIVTVCKLDVGQPGDEVPDLSGERRDMERFLDEEGVIAFPEVDFARDLVDGIVDVAQANGMAGIASNTVLLGWPEDPALQVDFLRAMRRLEALKKSLLFGRVRPSTLYRRRGVGRTIDIWWGGLQRNGDLMLLLTFLVTRNPAWRHAHVRVMSLASSDLARQNTERQLDRLIPEARINAEVRVLLKDPDDSVAEIIQRESADAELVLLGLATPERGREADYAQRLEALAGDLPNVFFIKNASMFMGELIQTDDQESAPAAGQDDTG
jgi:potassium/chloride transporter 4/5/6